VVTVEHVGRREEEEAGYVCVCDYLNILPPLPCHTPFSGVFLDYLLVPSLYVSYLLSAPSIPIYLLILPFPAA